MMESQEFLSGRARFWPPPFIMGRGGENRFVFLIIIPLEQNVK
ncbi:hypothetical protein B4135_2255 [Caldibacillus debilis]|uniref:Uncharacterized protein n=1 Tax=Caldibacillus debilis TaxID=301148 RepID=A0A150M228_9BACI|nr:hypothetical protein B4135_2255 [Caldibacillus debilis]